MRQKHTKLTDVSTMGETEPQKHLTSQTPGSKSRLFSKRASVSSCVAIRKGQSSVSLDLDLRPHTTPRSTSTPYGSTCHSLFLPTSDRSTRLDLYSNGRRRVTSGVSRVTMSSRSTARSWRKMTTTSSSASSQRTLTACSKTLASFPESTGTEPGTTIWLLENRQLVEIDAVNHGFFHEGNGYLILSVRYDETRSIHVWLGSRSDRGGHDILQARAESLDRHLDGVTFLSVEHEGHETDAFLSLFQDGLIVVEGKSKTSLKSATEYTKRLYIVRGRRFPVAGCAPCNVSRLAPDRAVILDGFPRIYVWLGPEVDNITRVKAIQVATKLRDYQRKGIGHIVIIDKKDTRLHAAFVRKLEGDDNTDADADVEDQSECNACAADTKNDEIADEDENVRLELEREKICQARLYRINGDRPMYDMPYVTSKPLQHKYLTSKECFILDLGPDNPLSIWIGANADTTTLYAALRRAQIFTHHNNYPSLSAICRITEGDEPPCFKSAFSDWCDKTSYKQRQLVRTYNVANIGRALYSKSDCRTIARMSELWSDDHFTSGNGVSEIWRIRKDNLQATRWDQPGIFNNCYCYVILYQESSDQPHVTSNIVYYWLGSKSSIESQKAAVDMVTALHRALEHKICAVRVLDGMEPKHFMTIFQYSMMVYDGDLCHDDDDELFQTTSLTDTDKDDDEIENGADGTDEDENDADGTDDGENNESYHKSDDVNAFCVRECVSGCMKVLQVAAYSYSLNSSAAFIIYTNNNAFVWYGKNASANEREYSKSMLDNLCPDRSHKYCIINEGREPNKFWDVLTKEGEYSKDFPQQLHHRRPASLCLYSKATGTFWNVQQYSQEDLNESDVYILDTFDQLLVWTGKDFDNNDCGFFLSLCQTYLKFDLAMRLLDDIQMWFVNQGFEPEVFTKHFPSWTDCGFGGAQAVEAARKQVRKENATIDVDCQMVDRSYIQSVKLPFKELVKGSQFGSEIDIHHKEHHITDKEFASVLHMSRAQFYRLPEWKQRQILRSARLRRVPFEGVGTVCSSVGGGGSLVSIGLSSSNTRRNMNSSLPVCFQ